MRFSFNDILYNIFFLSFITSVFAATGVEKYSYNSALSNNPSKWYDLNPNFASCGTGKSQSPIDIPYKTFIGNPRERPIVNKGAGYYTVQNSSSNFALKCTSDSCGSVSLENSTYSLTNVHFHNPSEHTRQGKRYPLEAHLVHQNSEGSLAVISILFDFGFPNYGLDKILRNLHSDMFPFSTDMLQDEPSSYCRYKGSLTTPPCSEGVNWILTQKVSTVTPSQIEKYANHVGIDGHGETYGNNRPVHSRNGRQVTCYPMGYCL